MTSNEHLERLLEMRRRLLREVARVEAMISVEMTHALDMASRHGVAWPQRDDLSWENALHEAKIPTVGDTLATD